MAGAIHLYCEVQGVTMPRLASGPDAQSLSGSLWFLPLLMTLAALILGLVLAQIHVRPDGSPRSGAVPWQRRGGATTTAECRDCHGWGVRDRRRPDARGTQVAANRYSPRLVRSFLRDRPTQVVLSLFMATFAYNAAGSTP